jgi:hypothetical protein
LRLAQTQSWLPWGAVIDMEKGGALSDLTPLIYRSGFNYPSATTGALYE